MIRLLCLANLILAQVELDVSRALITALLSTCSEREESGTITLSAIMELGATAS